MNNVKSSREETQEVRIARLAKIKSEAKLVGSYSAAGLDALLDKFMSVNNSSRKILYDAYIDYLQLIGMTYDDACYYAGYEGTFTDLSLVNEVEGIEYHFVKMLYPEQIFNCTDEPTLILSEVA